jgi:hypothetical protein
MTTVITGKATGVRPLFCWYSRDLNINGFFQVASESSLDGNAIIHLFVFCHSLKESNKKAKKAEPKQKFKARKYLLLLSTNNGQHIVVAERAPPLL